MRQFSHHYRKVGLYFMNKPKKMSYMEFIRTVSDESGYDEEIVRQIYDKGIGIIGQNAYQGRSVEIRNFGRFSTKKAQGRSVKLNNVSKFSSYTKFQFKPSTHFTRSNRALIGEIDSDEK